MNVKKTIRKVAALGAATAMVGATLFGAVAQSYTLGDYPQPFVMDGVFDPAQAVIVVGNDAGVSDVLGAIELAASLQADAVTIEPVEVDGPVDPTVADGVKIAKSGNDLNFGEEFVDVDSSLTDDDMPELLANGLFSESEGENDNDEEYDQTIAWQTGSGQLVYEQDDETDVTGVYVKLPEDADVYEYELDFDDQVDYDNTSSTTAEDDFEGATVEIQGNMYTVTGVNTDNNGMLNELQLLVGDVVKWVAQDAPINVGDHTVTVISVDVDGTKCGVEVDGETKWLTVGETKTVGGLEVGVLDAIAVHSELADQDTCELSLGSQELTLTDGQPVQINDQDVDGSLVTITETAGGEWEGFTIAFAPDGDDLFMAPGDEWTDPVLGNFKLMFEGLSAKTETVHLAVGSSKGTLTFNNIDGVEIEVPMVAYDSDASGADDAVGWGDDNDFIEDELLFNLAGASVPRGLAFLDGDNCGNASLTDVDVCEGVLVMVRTGAGSDEVRLFELTDVDTTDGELTFKDLASGKLYTDTYAGGTIDLGVAEIDVTVDDAGADQQVAFDNIDFGGEAQTEFGLNLDFDDNTVFFDENEGTNDDGATNYEINLTYDSGDDESIELGSSQSLDAATVGGLEEEEDGADDIIGSTEFGTLVRYDNENNDELMLTYPEEQVYANVFIAPVNAKVMAGGAGGVNAEKVNKIPVGMSVLDVDAESMSKHMLVVGGPCANIIADEVTGEKDSCVEGFEEGKAKIATYARNGKTVVLVAGYSAQDTLAAAYVLADYKEYPQLTGTAVELAVASLSDVTFVGTTA